MRTVRLLGPQRADPTLVQEVDRLGLDGAVALISAGWQERETEDGEMRAALGREVINLKLHERLEQVFAEDPDLFQAHRARQNRLRAIQELYRYRLDFALEPARELLQRAGDEELLAPERDAAIEALRALDRHHLARIRDVHLEFERLHRPSNRPAVARHRDELAGELQKTAVIAIAGGHVAVLLNRMRLFDVAELFGQRPIFAWSAGAMALSERVVLFHDSPPQGMGNPEVLDMGLGMVRDIVVLPHARHRLNLEDPARVEILARRFAPAVCVPFDYRAPAIPFTGGNGFWTEGARRLTEGGRVVRTKPEAA